MTDQIEEAIVRERDRIHGRRSALLEHRSRIDSELAVLGHEKAALRTYLVVRNGGYVPSRPQRGEWRAAVLAVVGQAPQGMTRGEVLTQMNLRGDRLAVMSVTNALAALKKSKILTHSGKKYLVA